MNISADNLQDWLIKNDINFIKNFNLSLKSWIKAGGIINTFIQPNNIDECEKLIRSFSSQNMEFYVLGNQSNTIIRDGLIKTPIINLSKLSNLEINNSARGLSIICGGGVPIPRFSKKVTDSGFSGAEGILGIPGTIGGGICMNASSYNCHVCDYISEVKLITKNGERFSLTKEGLKLRWRGSIVKDKKFIVLECKFLIPKKNYIGEDKTKKISKSILNHRKFYQEDEFPNLGSIFATKNIYEDLSKKNLVFFLLYILFKLGNIFFTKFNKKNLLRFRKMVIFLYLEILGLREFDNYSSSKKTLNCLINKGSNKSNDAINFLKKFKSKTNNFVEVENIILDDIA